MRKLLISSVFLFVSGAFANDIFWVRLEPRLSYKDLDFSCQTLMGPYIFIAGETDGTKIISAKLRLSSQSATPTNSIDLSAQETSASEIFTDEENRIWVKALHLDTKALNWIFFAGQGATIGGGCAPKKGLQSIEPGTVTYTFTAPPQKEGEKLPIFGMYSELNVFKGINGFGKPYRVELKFQQRQE